MNLTIENNRPQQEFHKLTNKYRGFIAGYGSGKSWAGGQALCAHAWQHPLIDQGYFAPTYPMIRDIFWPTIQEVAFTFHLNAEIKEGNKEVYFYFGRQYRGMIKCRSMDRPGSIIGFKIGHAVVDELDTLSMRKAEFVWRKILGRMRYKDASLKNGIDVMTTPEGFRFCHKLFVQQIQDNPKLSKNYGMIQASTYDNAHNLPKDYIDSMEEIYPSELVDAYINGQFVNLTSGTVYRNYDRVRNNSTEAIKEGEPLFIGQDFNVQHMASTVYVQRPDGWHAVAELKDVFDTPDVIKIIRERWKDKGHKIVMYPDATGSSRKTVDASKSDIALLNQAGFEVRAAKVNPPVKDRVLAMNKTLETSKVKVNAQACPTVARCLEQQAYDSNGEPDKTMGYDHQNDATTYPIVYEFPINRPVFYTGIGYAK